MNNQNIMFGLSPPFGKSRKIEKSQIVCFDECWIFLIDHFLYTVMLIEMHRYSVAKLLLHHYKSNLAHISDFDSLVIGLSKSEI